MNANVLRISCPILCDDKKHRVKLLFDVIDKWISSEELYHLVKIFGGNLSKTLTLESKIDYLNDFCERWDFRKNQANGGERWEIKDDEFVEKHSETIMELA